MTTEPKPDDTVCWVRVSFADLTDIKPSSELAKKIVDHAMLQESNWRTAYINAVERLVINPDLMVEEDAPISEPVYNEGVDGAYVMCWQFIPHAAVIPPANNTPEEITRSLERLKVVSTLTRTAVPNAPRPSAN